MLGSHITCRLCVLLFKQNSTNAANVFHAKRPRNTNAFTNERNTHSTQEPLGLRIRGTSGMQEPLSRESRRCQSSLRKARDFIWQHWLEKKRGYLVVTITSPDAASDVHMFIEPNDAGAWRVVWRWENLYCVSCPRPHTSGTIHQSAEMRSIDQKRATETDIDWPVGTRYLVFLDTYGNEVERL